jgi:hypothetical protein
MSSATVGFINPSGKYNHDPYRNQPLTIMYLLTYLEKHCGAKDICFSGDKTREH